MSRYPLTLGEDLVFRSQNYNPAQKLMLGLVLFNGLINDLEDGTADILQNRDGTLSGAVVDMLKGWLLFRDDSAGSETGLTFDMVSKGKQNLVP